MNTNQSTPFSAGCLILTLDLELVHVSFDFLNDPVCNLNFAVFVWWVFGFDIIALNM